jgi:hypothetical protein
LSHNTHLSELLPLLQELQGAKQQLAQSEQELENQRDQHHQAALLRDQHRDQVMRLAQVLDLCLEKNMDPTQAKLSLPSDPSDQKNDVEDYMYNHVSVSNNKSRFGKKAQNSQLVSSWQKFRHMFK